MKLNKAKKTNNNQKKFKIPKQAKKVINQALKVI